MLLKTRNIDKVEYHESSWDNKSYIIFTMYQCKPTTPGNEPKFITEQIEGTKELYGQVVRFLAEGKEWIDTGAL